MVCISVSLVDLRSVQSLPQSTGTQPGCLVLNLLLVPVFDLTKYITVLLIRGDGQSKELLPQYMSPS